MIQAIFFDLDGTLLSHQLGDVPESARKALKELRKKGIKIIAATGRSMMEIENLPINNIPFDFYITLNGQLCLNENKEVSFACPFQDEEKELSIRMFNEKEIPIMIVEKDRYYLNFVNEDVVIAQNEILTAIPDVDEYSGEEFYMLSVYANPEQEEMLKRTLKNCLVTRWNDRGIDIVTKDGGKVRGIQKYLELNHIPVEDTMAFGDGENDMAMLEYVHTGVALGNAKEIVKEKADFITAHIDDDGVYQALKDLKVL